MWGRKVKKAFPSLKFNPKVENCRRPKSKAPFFTECRKALRKIPGSSDLSRSRKEQYRALGWHVFGSGCWMRFAPKRIRHQVRASLATLFSSLSPGGSLGTCFSLLAWQWSRKKLFLRMGQPILESHQRVDGLHWSQTVLVDLGYSVERWETDRVSRDPSCDPNSDLGDAKEGIVCRFKLLSIVIWFFSFRISLWSKSDETENVWVAYHSTKGGCMQQVWSCERGNVGIILPSLSYLWRWRTGSFETPPRLSLVFNCIPLHLVGSMTCVIAASFSFQYLPVSNFFYIPASYNLSRISAKDLGFSYAFVSCHRSGQCPSPHALFCHNLMTHIPCKRPFGVFPSPKKQSAFQF